MAARRRHRGACADSDAVPRHRRRRAVAELVSPSYFAAKYMQEHGYRAIPVNPTRPTILGETCYPTLAAIPGAVDIVDCFRQPEEMPTRARGRRQGRQGAVDAARHPKRGGGQDRERGRPRRRAEPLRQDRARADHGRAPLGGREHGRDHGKETRMTCLHSERRRAAQGARPLGGGGATRRFGGSPL